MTNRLVFGVTAAMTVCFAGIAWGQSGGGTQIDASVNFVFNRLAPNPTSGIPVTHTYRVTLSGANQISEERLSQSGALNKKSGGMRVLGQTNSDANTGGTWHVGGANRLVRERVLPQSVETLTILVSGQTCQISVSNRLKPGYQDFKYPRVQTGEMQTFSQPQVAGTSCSIR